MKVNKFIPLLLIILCSYKIDAQSDSIAIETDSVMEFSLMEAQNYAIENYYVSINAELDVEAAKKKVWETTAKGLPQISASADFQYIPNPPILEFPGMGTIQLAPETNLTYGATVTQLIFSGEYIVGLQASAVYKSLSEETYEKTKIDIREGIARSYFAILILQDNREVLNKTLGNLKDNLNQLKETFAAGLIDDTEVDQLHLTVKRTENDLNTIDNQIETMRRLFKYQLGLTAEQTIFLTEKIDDLIIRNIAADTSLIFDLEGNIDFRMLTTLEKLQHLNMNREKTAYLPTISGFYSYSDQTESTDFSPSINHVLGISASWSIFQSGMRHAKISQAKIELEKIQNMKEQESENLILLAEQAKYNYITALQKYYNEKMNFELSEKVMNKTLEKFNVGMTSSLELSLINTQFLSAQISYSKVIQELLLSKIAVDKAYNQL